MARRRIAFASGALIARMPITGIVACCARAASGHATAAPLSRLMKSLRLNGAPPELEEALTLRGGTLGIKAAQS